MKAFVALALSALLVPRTAGSDQADAWASDWPQYMRDSAHTGNAPDEELGPSLGLLARVKLDDAMLTSPAVVGGRV